MPATSSADDLVRLEEELDLDRRVLVAVRAVHGVGLDALGEGLADRALGRVGRVGRAHDFAVALHRVVALEHLHHDRAARQRSRPARRRAGVRGGLTMSDHQPARLPQAARSFHLVLQPR